MAKKSKKNSENIEGLKNNFEASVRYIKESRNYIYASIIIFFIFSVAGFLIPAPESVENLIFEFVEEILTKTQGMNYIEITSFIFLNNLQSSFLGIVYGVLFGIFPVVTAAANGYLLGFVASESVAVGGFFILWRILPHGIFELPALFISLGMGIKFGTFVFAKQGKKWETFKKYFLNSIRAFLFVVVPLLIIAAVIEGALISFAG